MRIGAVQALCSLALLAGSSAGHARTQRIYDEQANAGPAVAAAVARADAEDKRVLVDFGANWCTWCRALHRVFHEDPAAKEVLGKGFVVVYVDVGKLDRNLPLARRYGVTHLDETGIPILVVLDCAGSIVKVQDAGDFEKPEHDGFDTAKVLRFLKAMAPTQAQPLPRQAGPSLMSRGRNNW